MLEQPASHLEDLDQKNMYIHLVFYHLGLNITVHNIKPRADTVKRANDYFDCIKTNGTERDGINTV